MKYKFKNTTLTIPDEEIANSMELLGLSKEQAIEMWLDDNDYTTNEVVEELTRKAKENKSVHSSLQLETAAKGKSKTRTKKEDVDKRLIISTLFSALSSSLELENLTIKNEEKYITFSFNGGEYELNLVKHRAKK